MIGGTIRILTTFESRHLRVVHDTREGTATDQTGNVAPCDLPAFLRALQYQRMQHRAARLPYSIDQRIAEDEPSASAGAEHAAPGLALQRR